jgi:hypothetical protein
MALFIISVPLTLVAVGVAVIPLIATSLNEARHLAREAEERLERHAHLHRQAHRAGHATQANAGQPTPPIDAKGHNKPERVRVRRWHEPVLLETR